MPDFPNSTHDDEDGVLPAWQSHDWTPHEEKFVTEWMRCEVLSRAYRAGWPDEQCSTAVAVSRARRLLAEPWMAGYITDVSNQIKARLVHNKDTILGELAKIAFANHADFTVVQADGSLVTDLSGLTRDQMASIQEVMVETYMDGGGEDAREVKSVKIKLHPKTSALEALGKHYKLFTDIIEDNRGGDVVDEIRRARDRKRKQRQNTDEENASDE